MPRINKLLMENVPRAIGHSDTLNFQSARHRRPNAECKRLGLRMRISPAPVDYHHVPHSLAICRVGSPQVHTFLAWCTEVTVMHCWRSAPASRTDFRTLEVMHESFEIVWNYLGVSINGGPLNHPFIDGFFFPCKPSNLWNPPFAFFPITIRSKSRQTMQTWQLKQDHCNEVPMAPLDATASFDQQRRAFVRWTISGSVGKGYIHTYINGQNDTKPTPCSESLSRIHNCPWHIMLF